MKLNLIGCSHHSSSIQVRERLAFGPEQGRAALRQLRDVYPESEAVLLSTCNRVELYLAGGDYALIPDHQQLVAFLATCHGLEPAVLEGQLFRHTGEDAVRHLFSVAASLDSMVVGEAQILSQVKQAFATAQQQQATGPVTHYLFETAYRVAKRVANETQINRRRVSIPSIAVADFAKLLFETFQDKKVLLLGAGKMGEETLRYLSDEGAQEIVVLNRNRQRAESLARRINASVDDWHQLEARLCWADLIVSTTGAREPIVTARRFRDIQQRRSERLLFILDLAVPRDFDPEVGNFTNVFLYCIDDLQSVCEKNRQARKKQWPQAQQIVDQETRHFMADLSRRVTAPTIQRLRQQADQLKDAEFQRLLNKLGELDPRSRNEIERSFDRLVNKLLHPPLESLRDEAARGSHHSLLDALRHLFQISD
jgi:glutamyl-tRNA reductase